VLEFITPISEQLAFWIVDGAWWIAPLIALIAGVLTSFLPCCLAAIPLVVGVVSGSEAKGRRGFQIALIFALGNALTLTALAVIAALLGQLMRGAGSWFYLILGVLMVLMALQMFGLINVLPGTHLLAKNKRRGYIGALLAGILSGLFSSACATPVLVVLLGLVAVEGNILWGVTLLLCYALGHSVLMVVAGTSVGLTNQISSSAKYKTAAKAAQITMGVLALLLGIYLLYLGF